MVNTTKVSVDFSLVQWEHWVSVNSKDTLLRNNSGIYITRNVEQDIVIFREGKNIWKIRCPNIELTAVYYTYCNII